jgi:ParB family chromosome partitioning protein
MTSKCLYEKEYSIFFIFFKYLLQYTNMQQYHNSIFWVETEKIKPNPYQPRKEFEPRALQDLADSIRQYGVLQPLVVTRKEIENDQGLFVEYELIAGERRLRASKLAGIPQVPVIIRAGQDSDKEKLELAIIENLQREDLNPIDRAQAFLKLAEEFKLTHSEIGKKMGKSREYVSNTLRLLSLPEEIRQALAEKKIAEGHTRPLMMLADRPAEQLTLFKEMVIKKLSVRESERIARGIATDKVRKKDVDMDPQIAQYQEKLAESLGTRVSIEKKEVGGKIVIDYFSPNDLQTILELLKSNESKGKAHMMEQFIASSATDAAALPVVQPLEIPAHVVTPEEIPVVRAEEIGPSYLAEGEPELTQPAMLDDRDQGQKDEEENTDLYNIDNFTI